MTSRLPEAQPTESEQDNGIIPLTGQSKRLFLVDIVAIIIMGLLLFTGISTQFPNRYNDVTRYQCYAIAFWQGQAGLQEHALQATPESQCTFLATSTATQRIVEALEKRNAPPVLLDFLRAQLSPQPFHILPPEYPFLTLIPFTIPLFLPFEWYQVVFALLMIVLAAGIYLLLVRYHARSSALAFAFYLSVGSWATAAGRFDLIPAALTLGALLLARKAYWKWAFALLALATLYKFYPVLLAIPFLLAQQMEDRTGRWFAWRRWSALGLFVALGVVITAISLLFNVAGTLAPFTYFIGRPFESGSFPASILWLGGHLGYPIHYIFTYQSLNIVSPLASIVSPLMLLLEVAGLLYTFWLQWRGKIRLYESVLLTVLIILLTGKVFSPQYLIWVSPFIALVGRANWKWLVTWGLVCVLTTFIFPFHFNGITQLDQAYPAVVARNLLILALTVGLLYQYRRRQVEAIIAWRGQAKTQVS